MREVTIKIAFIIGVILMIQSCYNEYPPELSSLDQEKVSFNRDVLPILSQNCGITQCHDGLHAPDLRNDTIYDNVSSAYRDLVFGSPGSNPKGKTYINTTFPERSELLEAIISGVGGLNMPPDGALSERDIEIIKAWMLKGAPND